MNDRAWRLVDPGRLNKETDVALGLRLARHAVDISPSSGFLDTLAWALFANGQYDEALSESASALDLANEDRKPDYQGYLDRLLRMIEEARAAKPQAEDDQ